MSPVSRGGRAGQEIVPVVLSDVCTSITPSKLRVADSLTWGAGVILVGSVSVIVSSSAETVCTGIAEPSYEVESETVHNCKIKGSVNHLGLGLSDRSCRYSGGYRIGTLFSQS